MGLQAFFPFFYFVSNLFQVSFFSIFLNSKLFSVRLQRKEKKKQRFYRRNRFWPEHDACFAWSKKGVLGIIIVPAIRNINFIILECISYVGIIGLGKNDPILSKKKKKKRSKISVCFLSIFFFWIYKYCYEYVKQRQYARDVSSSRKYQHMPLGKDNSNNHKKSLPVLFFFFIPQSFRGRLN